MDYLVPKADIIFAAKRTFNVEARGTDPPNRLTAENAWYLKGVTHR